MNVNLHIDSIVLDGIELGAGQERLLQQLVSRELTTLLQSEGLANAYDLGKERSKISGGTIRVGATGNLTLGQQLAGSIHQSLNFADSRSTTANGGTD